MDLTEAEDSKKRWQEYTEELHKKYLHDQDNHDGALTHLEPDILECEVKWALGSITTNKASGGDGIPAELFQILKDGAVNVLPSTCHPVWKPERWPRDWEGQFSPQSQRRAVPGQAQTAAHGGKATLRTLQAGLQQHASREPSDSSWTQKRHRNQRPNFQHSLDHRKSKRILGKHLLLLH